MTVQPIITVNETQDQLWSQIEPCYRELAFAKLTATTVEAWLKQWTRLKNLLDEIYWRLYVATTIDTTNQAAGQEYKSFFDNTHPRMMVAEQKLKTKLLKSGLTPHGLDIPLRNIRCEAELYRETNVSLISKLYKMAAEYGRIIGAQTVTWDGKEITLTQLQPLLRSIDRQVREDAWKLAANRQLADREAINSLWVKYLNIRRRVAVNADLPDYRAYRWQRLLRFDYTPQDCYRFHQAIKKVAVPAAQRIYQRRRERMNLQSLRPWDLDVDPLGRPPLHPFKTTIELETTFASIFRRLDPQLAGYFDLMRNEKLLDLESRSGKSPGAYCTEFRLSKRPFIFMNASGVHDDVTTLAHEAGHAIHVFETNHLPYHLQYHIPLEFMEVASTAMEFLIEPYLRKVEGGFYTPGDAARACIRHLEQIILFWPYMAVVDGFQHWVYENPSEAALPANCDAMWLKLWHEYMLGPNYDGLEKEIASGWQQKIHIHEDPFYYVEYGLSQLAATQIWMNAMQDQEKTLYAYRKSLSLGGTVSLPELYSTAGARFAFDAKTLGECVAFLEDMLGKMEVID